MIQPEVNYDEKNVFYIDDIISGLFEDEAVFLDEKSLDFKDCRFNKMVFAESKMIKEIRAVQSFQIQTLSFWAH